MFTRVAVKALLRDEWTEIHAKSFRAIKDGVANAVKLAHVRDEATLCLFTDASDLVFGAVLTQNPADVFDAEGDPNTWPHEPFGFISGAFKYAQLTGGPFTTRRGMQSKLRAKNLPTC